MTSPFRQPGRASNATGSSDALTPEVEALIEADHALVVAMNRAEEIKYLAEKELLKREAKRLADALERKDDTQPVWRSLYDQLQLPLNEQQYAIEGLLPLGGNALFAGKYKAGKTTFNGQLLKAWADGELFLGRWKCHPDPDRPVVTIFNYEMSEDQFQRWLGRVGITEDGQKRVHVVHLRGHALPLGLPEVRADVARQLAERGTGLWIIDPASRALGAADGNDNSDVAQFCAWLDEIKREAGVRDLVMNIHMGHAAGADKSAERAIGAQAWSAWADALWFLNKKDDHGVESRWFRADGRDVSVPELMVNYNDENMSVLLVETNAVKMQADNIRMGILKVVGNNPGCSVNVILDQIKAYAKGRTGEITATVKTMITDGDLIMRPEGQKHCHFITEGNVMLPGAPTVSTVSQRFP